MLQIVTVAAAKRILKLSRKFITPLPSFKSLKGVYSSEVRSRERRILLVPTQSAISAAVNQKHISGTEPTLDMLDGLDARHILDFMACCAIATYDPRTHQVGYGISCVGCQIAIAPVDLTRDEALFGNPRDMVYSEEQFLNHFAKCKEAQIVWSEYRNDSESSADILDL
jgi:hypothetical protein